MTFRNIYLIAISIWGCVVVYGTYKRWPFLVGPLETHSKWRMRFDGLYRMRVEGTKGAVINMYIIGVGLTVGGVVGLLLP